MTEIANPKTPARLLPGLAFCIAVTALAYGLAALQRHWLHEAWMEPIVLAIVIGAAVRTAWTPPPSLAPGVIFAGKTLLEVAIVLLGLSMSALALLAAGPALPLGIAFVVVAAIA